MSGVAGIGIGEILCPMLISAEFSVWRHRNASEFLRPSGLDAECGGNGWYQALD